MTRKKNQSKLFVEYIDVKQ